MLLSVCLRHRHSYQWCCEVGEVHATKSCFESEVQESITQGPPCA